MLSNFDPATNSILIAKNGSVYDRTLVNPDYKDWAPRVGLAYSVNPKTVVRGGYGISYVHLNRLGSADELGINGPQVDHRHYQSDHSGRTARCRPASSRAIRLPARPHQPGQFHRRQRQHRLHSQETRAGLTCRPGSSRSQRELMKTPWSKSGTAATTARACRSSPTTIRRFPTLRARRSASSRAVRIRHSAPSPGWTQPASRLTTVSRREFEHRFAARPVFPELVHLVEVARRYRAGTRIRLRLLRRQSAEHLQPESGARPFQPRRRIRQHDQPGLPASFRQGAEDRCELESRPERRPGRMGDEHHQHRQFRDCRSMSPIHPARPTMSPAASRIIAGWRIMRPNVAVNPGATPDTINHYYGGYTFAIPPASAPFGNAGRNAFRGPTSGSGTWASTRASPSPSVPACNSAPSSSTS